MRGRVLDWGGCKTCDSPDCTSAFDRWWFGSSSSLLHINHDPQVQSRSSWSSIIIITAILGRVSQQPVYRQELSGGSDEWWRPGPDQSALGRLSICQFFWVCQIFGIVKYLVRVNIHEKSINGNSASENLDFVLLSRCSSGGNSLWGIHPLHPLHFFCSKAHIN